ncbi:MAG: septal ring lytic transglycosylase RlpA family protein [Treponema sp.]|jgi:rare lipoprotein A|nr:septal ring lytic transglycosylase RlpA family protein [Treponema sp.]
MKRLIFFLLIVTGITAFSAAQTANIEPIRQEGIASWYGQEFAGRPTASGEIFDPGVFTAAHPNLPFGTILTVTNKQNMRQVTVRVNDRGPFVAARIIDLSKAAAEALDMITAGTVPVILERAVNTTLGPVAGSSAPVVVVPDTAPEPYIARILPPEPVNIMDYIPAYPPIEAESRISPPPVVVEPAPIAIQPAQNFYPAPAARILGNMPPAGSTKLYRLQVGAYKVPRNALDTFEKLKNAGLNPSYEPNDDFYRVVLVGLKAGDIPAIAQILGNYGFQEALIREER